MTTDTSAAMDVDTDDAAVEGLVKYITKAATPSIARVHCIVSLKALAAERDAMKAEWAADLIRKGKETTALRLSLAEARKELEAARNDLG